MIFKVYRLLRNVSVFEGQGCDIAVHLRLIEAQHVRFCSAAQLDNCVKWPCVMTNVPIERAAFEIGASANRRVSWLRGRKV